MLKKKKEREVRGGIEKGKMQHFVQYSIGDSFSYQFYQIF
jgi:hypothetical protein